MKAVIDKHFTDNYNYYFKICKYHYPKYLTEDLLHEMYLDMVKLAERKPETIATYNEIDRLKPLFIRTIKSLFQDRGRGKYHEDGNTSPLYETPSVEIEIGYEMDTDNINPLELEREERKMKRNYDNIQELKKLSVHTQPEVDTKKPSEYLKTQVFFLANEPGMSRSKLAKEMNVSRTFINMVYEAGREHLQKKLI